MISNQGEEINSFSAQDAKYVDCILEEYKANKEEISRRSTLQRVALLAYGAIVSFVLKDVRVYFCADPELKEAVLLLIWLASFTTQCFYISEDFSIKRLANLININISDIQEKLNLSSSETQSLFLSIASHKKPEEYEDLCPLRIRQVFTLLFFVTYFLVIPAYFVYFFKIQEKMVFLKSDLFSLRYSFIIWAVISLTFASNLFIWIAIIFANDRFRKNIEQ